MFCKSISLSRNFDFHYNLGLWITLLLYNVSLVAIYALNHQDLIEGFTSKTHMVLSIVFLVWALLEIFNRSLLVCLLGNKISDYRLPHFYLDTIRIGYHLSEKERNYYWAQFNFNIVCLVFMTLWIAIQHTLYSSNQLLWILIITKIVIYLLSFGISSLIQKYCHKNWEENQFNLLPIRYSPTSLSLDMSY